MIVGIRTDSAITALCLLKNDGSVDTLQWEADRTLAATIHQKLLELLQRNQANWRSITGWCVIKGPDHSLVYELASPLATPWLMAWKRRLLVRQLTTGLRSAANEFKQVRMIV